MTERISAAPDEIPTGFVRRIMAHPERAIDLFRTLEEVRDTLYGRQDPEDEPDHLPELVNDAINRAIAP